MRLESVPIGNCHAEDGMATLHLLPCHVYFHPSGGPNRYPMTKLVLLEVNNNVEASIAAGQFKLGGAVKQSEAIHP